MTTPISNDKNLAPGADRNLRTRNLQTEAQGRETPRAGVEAQTAAEQSRPAEVNVDRAARLYNAENNAAPADESRIQNQDQARSLVASLKAAFRADPGAALGAFGKLDAQQAGVLMQQG